MDVARAVEEFQALERNLEEDEKKEKAAGGGGAVEAGDEFNIREFFEESVRQEASKGHKPKRVVCRNSLFSTSLSSHLLPSSLSPLSPPDPPRRVW